MAGNGENFEQSDGLIDELPISSMWQSGSDVDQRVERQFHVAAAVPAKDELVEVAAQVRLADAVVGAERPALEIGEDSVDPWQHDMRRHRADDRGLVVIAFEAFVGREAVAENRGARFDSAGNEGADTGG